VQEHGDQVRVIGLGSQDSLGLAQQFMDATGTAGVEMYWDPNFESWSYYQVRSQPTAILLDPQGVPLQGWRGSFDEDKVLELASEFS
jgi:hypothetical protein